MLLEKKDNIWRVTEVCKEKKSHFALLGQKILKMGLTIKLLKRMIS